MRIVCLVDNVSNKKSLGCEHGLSLYIETAMHKLLFDLGASSLFVKNAVALGVDLKTIDTVILSHGHYDHGEGLKTFLNVNDTAVIYIKKEAFGDYYSERISGTEYIGLDKSLSQNSRIVFVVNDIIIDEELKLFSGVNIVEERFSANKKLKIKIGTEFREDDFAHEQNLIINSGGVKVLVAGCAHNGITNIIRKFVEMESADPNYVFSGFHLSNPNSGKSEDETVIYKVGNRLNEYNTKYFTCHCTGIEPYKKLNEILNNKVEYFAAGDTLKV